MNPDLLDYLASALVLATFGMRDMRALRLTAIASNLAFIGYGVAAGIEPVLMLHVLLLPLNLRRLREIARTGEAGRALPTIRRWQPNPEVTAKPRSACSRAWSPSSSGRACTRAPTTPCTSRRR